jgi:hypothetical protein
MMLFLAAPAEAHHPAAAATPVAATDQHHLGRHALRGTDRRIGTLRIHPARPALRCDLLAAASNGTHAHSIRSIDAVSLSAAYGITND